MKHWNVKRNALLQLEGFVGLHICRFEWIWMNFHILALQPRIFPNEVVRRLSSGSWLLCMSFDDSVVLGAAFVHG